MARKVWTNRRKWLGNLLPALFFLPLNVWGIYWMMQNETILGKGLWLVALGTVCGWIGLNLFGLVGNAYMRRALKRELVAKHVDFNDPHFFVGFASPKFINILDAHEDIGFLFLREEMVEFVGESNNVKVPKVQIQRVIFRPNVHTWVGIGRWICIEGLHKKTRFRLSIEPRERNFLLMNLIGSGAIKKRILDWLKG
ncbi:MAG: hypothetical protein H7Y17_06525 [Chlorobia bacterium]|nr:hypothetical protein [Fimbriimonadaceae bacterium]